MTFLLILLLLAAASLSAQDCEPVEISDSTSVVRSWGFTATVDPIADVVAAMGIKSSDNVNGVTIGLACSSDKAAWLSRIQEWRSGTLQKRTPRRAWKRSSLGLLYPHHLGTLLASDHLFKTFSPPLQCTAHFR